MILLDTSAVIALANEADPNHERAARAFRRVLDDREPLLVHNYVVLESLALLQRRLGLESALAFAAQSQEFDVHWITHDDHEAAVTLLTERGRRGLSLVDCASFVMMRRLGVTQALTFDADFEAEGFEAYRADDA